MDVCNTTQNPKRKPVSNRPPCWIWRCFSFQLHLTEHRYPQTLMPRLVATRTCLRGVPRSAPTPSGLDAIVSTHQESWSDAIFGQPSSAPLSAGQQEVAKRGVPAWPASCPRLLSASLESLPTFPDPGRIPSGANAGVRSSEALLGLVQQASQRPSAPSARLDGLTLCSAVGLEEVGNPKIPACANGIAREI